MCSSVPIKPAVQPILQQHAARKSPGQGSGVVPWLCYCCCSPAWVRRPMSLGLAPVGKAQQGRGEVFGEGPQPSSTRMKKVFPFVWYFGPPRPGPWIDPRAWAQGRAWVGVSGPKARSRRIRRERESQSKREGEGERRERSLILRLQWHDRHSQKAAAFLSTARLARDADSQNPIFEPQFWPLHL